MADDYLNLTLREILDMAGHSEADLKDKSQDEIIKLSTASIKTVNSKMREKTDKIYLENAEKKFPKYKENATEGLLVYVKNLKKNLKSESLVKFLTINPDNSKLIVLSADKLYQVEESNLITTQSELDKIINPPKKKKKSSGGN
jgi:hypothetical protein